MWFTAYRIMRADKTLLEKGHVYDLEDVRVIVFWGSFQYLDVSRAISEILDDGTVHLDPNVKHTEARESAWLLILQPYIVDGVQRPEYEIRKRAGIQAALFAAINGRNMAFQRVTDNIIMMKEGGMTTASSPMFTNPHAFPVPDVSVERCKFIRDAALKLQQQRVDIRHRIELSLHWFEKGIRAVGLDGFINCWVAIETLGMPDTTDIRPLNHLLTSAYNISQDEARDKFGVGKVFGLRSRILHNGEDLPINQLLSEYMECLYLDFLLESLGLPSERKAIKVLSKPEFDLNKLLHIAA